MKVLYVCRLFTGLEQSLKTRRWQPTGAPTISRMIERLDKHASDVRFILTRKDVGRGSFSGWTERNDCTLKIDGLQHEVRVLAGDERFPSWFGRWARAALRELRHLFHITWQFWRFRPDVIYVDHANFLTAGIFARVLKVPVVYRLMGVYPAMRKALVGNRIGQRALRWSYRAPYALVVCTQDGSGVEPWLKQALRADVCTEVLLNGVDEQSPSSAPDSTLATIPKDRLRILFIGKLEYYKGCEEFVDAVLRVLGLHLVQLHAIVIGTGSHREALIKKVTDAGFSTDFTFIERLPHAKIADAHRIVDIYVSMNWLGNLSNANLEAMSLGDCMIFPESDPETGIDVVTDQLIGVNSARRISRENAVEALSEVIADLIANPEERTRLGRSMEAAAKHFIPSWEQRISHEYLLLETLSATAMRNQKTDNFL
ncbi:MAG: hypothetical protein ACD_81C00171G0003 [uncultured bacterium]|nr:MAG: hypothetical protein ACD_81C00171G0003 [uncultured bacterium]